MQEWINEQPKRLRRFRKLKSVSQLELELTADLALGTISRIENGKINPTKETLIKIACALGLSQRETIELFCLDIYNQIENQESGGGDQMFH